MLGLVGAGLVFKERLAKYRKFESLGVFLDALSVLGLFTCAAIVSVYGKFLLGGVLAFFGLLMLARFKRGRVRSK